MPTYDYYCRDCDDIQELALSYEESLNPQKCRKCHKPMRKEYQLSGISFKGPGFYKNDYPKETKKED